MKNLIAPLLKNHQLNEYQVQRTLGQGGFGTTYLCFDQNLGRNCVIKEFTPHRIIKRQNDGKLKAKDRYRNLYEKGLNDFLSEARRLARFNHSNIVHINRYFEINNAAYFVMDYEYGNSLRSILSKRENQLEEQEIEALILPLCDGLEQLHKNQLIHRDIKPDNIIIRPDGSPILIDFGAAIDLNDEDPEIIATPSYAPIEQYDSNYPQGPWVDIYALAATIYEIISGYPPPHVLSRLKNDEIIPARNIGRGKYGDRLLELIDKGLAIDPLERPQNIAEFLSFLKIDNERYLRGIICGLSEKTIQHFLNFASPNDGLYVDEFVAFTICFPIIDISWRIGKGTPTKELFLSLYKSLDQDVLELCHNMVSSAGFNVYRRNLTLKTVESRLDEYSATYLLDRQEDKWVYSLTRNQCAKNCLAEHANKDVDGFMDLMGDVMDRSRGRIKKEFEKAFRKVIWIHTPKGWLKKIRSFV